MNYLIKRLYIYSKEIIADAKNQRIILTASRLIISTVKKPKQINSPDKSF
jgi:hypothetical protein